MIAKKISAQNIETISGFSKIFHLPLKQHFYYYLYNRAHDYEIAVERAKTTYLPLNKANFNFGRFCKNCISDLKESSEENYSETIALLQENLDNWQQIYTAGNVFNTIKFARLIIENLRRINYPLATKFKENPELIQSFISIPYPVKANFHITVIVSEELILDFLQELIQIFQKEPSLSYYVGEVLLSEKNIELEGERYHTLKIGLLPTVVNSKRNPIINELLAIILPLVRKHKEVDFNINPFSINVGKNTFLSQGNSNYKHFLDLLGVLDQVYHSSGNYAYCVN